MFELYGGTVAACGELVHGKTTKVTHDSKGLFLRVPQGIECTRYHSLAAVEATLPHALEITSTTPSGVIMGVRHKVFVMEGVQFHPESIASEAGNLIFANFLSWEGGRWDTLKIHKVKELPSTIKQVDVPFGAGISLDKLSKLNSTTKPSILETIKAQRLIDVQELESTPGRSISHLQKSLALGLAPQLLQFKSRLEASIKFNGIAVLAEIKRASPSKGNIDLTAHAPSQAILYARGGAATISVLTEPKWFKGSMQDLTDVRSIFKTQDRPCILCKDFILTTYQIIQARLAGADTVLLIVAILPKPLLLQLLSYSRSLGMEPLVEVATADEMTTALDVGAQVIGINNRDLNTFVVDMDRTTRLAHAVPSSVILIALSGIRSRADVERYVSNEARGILVGQTLMESLHAPSMIRELMGLIVKICGVTTVHDATLCSKATHIGLIFAASPRQITHDAAKVICASSTCVKVGVFMNQSVEFINAITEIDIVQVHSFMSVADLLCIHKPIWYVIIVKPESTAESVETEFNRVGPTVAHFLVDTAKGSTASIDTSILDVMKARGWRFIVAGGLGSENVRSVIGYGGVDVCSGVEMSKGVKDQAKVDAFLKVVNK